MSGKFCVIGGNAAGLSAASTAKRNDRGLEVEVFEAGSYVSYANCGIPYFIGGMVSSLDRLFAVSREELEGKRGIKLRLRHRVEKVDPTAKSITVADLDAARVYETRYDHLAICTGAVPLMPAGIDLSLPGVFTLRGLSEAARVRAFLAEHGPKRAVLVGAGFIGLEMAEALVGAGVAVTMVSRDRVMSVMEEEIVAEIVAELSARGLTIITGQTTTRVARSRAGGLTVELSDGQELDADLVMFGIGVAPDNRVAAAAGLELGAKGAIKVDRRQRTSAPGIWAGGDCAEAYHRILDRNVYVPLALTANRAGRVIGANVVGGDEEFPGILGSAVFKTFDLGVARTGLGFEEARAAGFEVVKSTITDRSRPGYYPGSARLKVVTLAERGTGRLLGAQMAGNDGVGHRINIFAAALGAGMTLQQVYDLDLAYAPPFSPVWDPVLNASKVAMKAR